MALFSNELPQEPPKGSNVDKPLQAQITESIALNIATVSASSCVLSLTDVNGSIVRSFNLATTNIFFNSVIFTIKDNFNGTEGKIDIFQLSGINGGAFATFMDLFNFISPYIVSCTPVGGGSGNILSINGDVTAAQTLTKGTTGTDFDIVDNGLGDHKFNLPTASSVNRGALSPTDWATFNNKQNALGFTPENVINKQNSLAIDGSGVKYPTIDAINAAGFITSLAGVELQANKNASGGYVGLDAFKIQIKNTLGTFISLIGNANTAIRNYTLQDRDGILADDTDLATKQATLTDVNFGTFANSLTAKTTPLDVDLINIVDTADSNKQKKVTFTNIKAFLKTYFDTLYQSILVSGTNIKTVNGNNLLGAGNVAVGDALVANPLNQFASTTSAQLAATISDETGTGVAVFNNAPSLINPDVTTQAPGNNTTKAASTAFVQAAIALLSAITQVANYAALPAVATVTGRYFWVSATTISNPAGLYYSNGVTYEFQDILGKTIAGFVAGAGTVTASDTILSAFNKIVGNLALKGDAFVSQPLNQFVATTSAQLASIISDETGSGALVFASAPTLSNPIVGTQTPLDNSTKGASTAYVDLAVTAANVTPYAETPSGTINGVNMVFTLAHAPANWNNVILLIDGVVQYYGIDFTGAGTTITMTYAPASGGFGIFAMYNSLSLIGTYATLTGVETLTNKTFNGIKLNYIAVTSVYNIVLTDYTIDCTSGTFAVNLPNATTCFKSPFSIINSGSGVITLTGFGAQVIGNVSPTNTVVMTAGMVLSVQSDGANWKIYN